MSGFAGMVNLDGAPIDGGVLRRLTDFLKFRGPDGQRVWAEGCAGFGHTLFKASASTEACQPFSLDGKTWIVGHCRVDGRAALLGELERRGQQDISGASDEELVLRAYQVWGERCVDHLLGDFAFAIWDGERRRLFCARDQLGVKPFFYARLGSLLIFSNALDCIRLHPGVSDQLNDLAVADFLLFDMIREPGATSFADIHRLPPAHLLICENGQISVNRYWSLAAPAAIHYKQLSDYIDRFRELLDEAVTDRLRTGRAGVLMSGGLDSTTVAASAVRVFARQNNMDGLRAYTEVFDSLIPHEERHYAGLAAETLKISIEFHVNEHSAALQDADRTECRWPEPQHSPWVDWGQVQLREVANTNRVLLTGYGGDPALCCLLSRHFLKLLKQGRVIRSLLDITRYLRAEGRFSRLYIRTRLGRWFSGANGGSSYPVWLNRGWEKRLSLRERWEKLNRSLAPTEAVRPVAYEAVTDPAWPALFEGYDAGTTGVPVEVRHPLFDLRLLNFLLALPALPWSSDKELLRETARGVLPDTVRLRRKSPLPADPLIALLQQTESAWVDSFVPVPELGRYVQRELIPRVFREKNAWTAWIHLRPLSLNFWLWSKAAAG